MNIFDRVLLNMNCDRHKNCMLYLSYFGHIIDSYSVHLNQQCKMSLECIRSEIFYNICCTCINYLYKLLKGSLLLGCKKSMHFIIKSFQTFYTNKHLIQKFYMYKFLYLKLLCITEIYVDSVIKSVETSGKIK